MMLRVAEALRAPTSLIPTARTVTDARLEAEAERVGQSASSVIPRPASRWSAFRGRRPGRAAAARPRVLRLTPGHDFSAVPYTPGTGRAYTSDADVALPRGAGAGLLGRAHTRRPAGAHPRPPRRPARAPRADSAPGRGPQGHATAVQVRERRIHRRGLRAHRRRQAHPQGRGPVRAPQHRRDGRRQGVWRLAERLYLNNVRYVGVKDRGAIPEGTFQFRHSEDGHVNTMAESMKMALAAPGQYVDPAGLDLHGDWGAAGRRRGRSPDPRCRRRRAATRRRAAASTCTAG